jgi:disulfide bond formation protein DsbB
MIHTRSLLLSIAIGFGLIGVALYLQHGLDMLPARCA